MCSTNGLQMSFHCAFLQNYNYWISTTDKTQHSWCILLLSLWWLVLWIKLINIIIIIYIYAYTQTHTHIYIYCMCHAFICKKTHQNRFRSRWHNCSNRISRHYSHLIDSSFDQIIIYLSTLEPTSAYEWSCRQETQALHSLLSCTTERCIMLSMRFM